MSYVALTVFIICINIIMSNCHQNGICTLHVALKGRLTNDQVPTSF